MKIFGDHDQKTIDQLKEVEQKAVATVLCADGHFGYVMPVGGVAAYDNQVSVPGVGFDIACGNCAIKTDLKLSDISKGKLNIDDINSNPYLIPSDRRLEEISKNIRNIISFGIGRTNNADDAPTDDPLFLDDAWYIIPNIGRYRDDLRENAQRQLGTVGSGNHYVDIFVDRADNSIWVGVHFGSRGLGHTIAKNFLAIGQGGTWGDKGSEVETILNLSTDAGREYWALMELAGKYAYAGREWVAKKVVDMLGGVPVDMVHNHHNFAWKETHWIDNKNKDVIVVRKGATPAFPGQRGFVGGSMGDDAVILQGTITNTNPQSAYSSSFDFSEEFRVKSQQKDALFSTVHGAGRVMSRTEAAGKRDRKSGQLKRHKVTGEIINAGKITHTMMKEWLNKEGVLLAGGGLDEAPQAYRRLTEVLKAQGDTVTVLNALKPIVVAMASGNEFDPYAD